MQTDRWTDPIPAVSLTGKNPGPHRDLGVSRAEQFRCDCIKFKKTLPQLLDHSRNPELSLPPQLLLQDDDQMKAIEVGAQAALLGALGTSWTPLGGAVPVAQAPSPGVGKQTLVDSLKCGPWSNLF